MCMILIKLKDELGAEQLLIPSAVLNKDEQWGNLEIKLCGETPTFQSKWERIGSEQHVVCFVIFDNSKPDL